MHTHGKIDVIPLYTCFLRRTIYFLLAAAFLGLLAFFAAADLRAFFAGLAAALVDVFAALGADDGAAVEAADGTAAAFIGLDLDFDAPADFFFGDATFFFGLFALRAPAAFGLAAAFDFGLAVLAFFAVVAFFLVAVEAAAGAGAGDVAVVTVVAVAVVLAFATFFGAAFFVGDAERFRLVAPPAALALLGDRAFFVLVPAGFLLPLGVFDRLLGFDEVDFLVPVFFLPAADALFVAGAANLKLPLAPTPLVCRNVSFFVPARNADLRC